MFRKARQQCTVAHDNKEQQSTRGRDQRCPGPMHLRFRQCRATSLCSTGRYDESWSVFSDPIRHTRAISHPPRNSSGDARQLHREASYTGTLAYRQLRLHDVLAMPFNNLWIYPDPMAPTISKRDIFRLPQTFAQIPRSFLVQGHVHTIPFIITCGSSLLPRPSPEIAPPRSSCRTPIVRKSR